MVDKVAPGQALTHYFCFPCQSSNRLLHTQHHHPSSGVGTVGQTVADVSSGLNLTLPQGTKISKLECKVKLAL
jgi:hypothetical protein